MKKICLLGCVLMLFGSSVFLNQSFAEVRHGYERVEEECSLGGFQIRCRWNDAASCNISEQTTCGDEVEGIG